MIASIALHVAVFGAAFLAARSKAARRATTVAVIGATRKKAAEKPPAPKPRPLLTSARPTTVSPQTAAPKTAQAEPPTASRAAPVDTGLTLGNSDEGGISLGGPAAKSAGPAPSGAAAHAPKGVGAQRRDRARELKDDPEGDTCTEAPSKPLPVQRPSEIEYTQEARANNIEGRLVLRITVGADGSVLRVEVLAAVDPALDAAAVAAVKTWVFRPSMRCGRAMAGGVYTVAKSFELSD
jgi:protein TonB